MKKSYVLGTNVSKSECDIYADKSSIVLDWLLRFGVTKEQFSLREVAAETSVSLGLVQRVFKTLVFRGLLETRGLRTAKKFFLKKPERLFKSWIDRYSIGKKCKMWTYQTAYGDREEVLSVLEKSKMSEKVKFALHSAAEVYGCKNTNLNTLELYMIDSSIRLKLEKKLHLIPQERGYEVLLLEPHYKSLLTQNQNASSPLLTFLDLYHFPLRGEEQAEFMAERVPELQRFFAK